MAVATSGHATEKNFVLRLRQLDPPPRQVLWDAWDETWPSPGERTREPKKKAPKAQKPSMRDAVWAAWKDLPDTAVETYVMWMEPGLCAFLVLVGCELFCFALWTTVALGRQRESRNILADSFPRYRILGVHVCSHRLGVMQTTLQSGAVSMF